MIKNKFFFLSWIFSIFWLIGCSAFDTKNTANLYRYPPPVLSNLRIVDNEILFNIDNNMYYPDHEDFQYYIILSGDKGTDFKQSISNIGDLTSVSTIPDYLARTTKPSVTGSYLNRLEFKIYMSNFQELKTYDFATISFGYNASVGKLYQNNGWLYSDPSTSVSLHIPKVLEGSISNATGGTGGTPPSLYAGISLDAMGDWVIVNNSFDDGIYLDTNSYTKNGVETVEPIIHPGANGKVGIQILGHLNTGEATKIPVDNYSIGKASDNYFFSLPKDYFFALKSITGNTYARLYIVSKETSTIEISGVDYRLDIINFKLTYSTIANENFF